MNAGFVSGLLALGMSFLASSAFAALRIEVDKSAQTLTVTRDGETLYTWPVSTGKSGYATPSGNFTVFRMEAEHYSKEWDDAPMPHSVFFTKQGHAIHGSYEVKRLGSPASHGCVRLAPKNAAKLFAMVKEEGLPNTEVVLTGSEQIALERVKAQRIARSAAPSPNRQPQKSVRASELATRDVRLPNSRLSPNEYYAQPGYAARYEESPRYDYSTQSFERPLERPLERPHAATHYYLSPPNAVPRRYAPYESRGLFFN